MNEILTCEGLTKSYQKGTNALDGIDLHIGFGRIVGLLGPNGSTQNSAPASAEKQRQDHPHQTGERPLAAHGGQHKNRGHGPRPGHESHRLLSAGRRMAARLDAGGAAGGDVPGFLRRLRPRQGE